MQPSETFLTSIIPIEPTLNSINSAAQKTKTSRPKLSMVWVQEFDGERQRLVAKWTTQD